MARRSAERVQFLKDVLITAVEGGINYWAAVIDYDPDAGTALICDREECADCLGSGSCEHTHEINIDVIARGWGKYKGETFQGREYGKLAMKANRTNGEDGDYDADIADNVLQLGLFGEIVYG